MKQVIIIIFSFLLVFYVGAQSKTSSPTQKSSSLCQSLKGRWQAEDDKDVVLVFNGKKYIELYDKDTTDNLEYTLSYSCKLQDRIKTNVYKLDKSKPLYVLLYKDGEVQQCNELLSLSGKTLSWMNNANGKIFIFKRI